MRGSRRGAAFARGLRRLLQPGLDQVGDGGDRHGLGEHEDRVLPERAQLRVLGDVGREDVDGGVLVGPRPGLQRVEDDEAVEDADVQVEEDERVLLGGEEAQRLDAVGGLIDLCQGFEGVDDGCP